MRRFKVALEVIRWLFCECGFVLLLVGCAIAIPVFVLGVTGHIYLDMLRFGLFCGAPFMIGGLGAACTMWSIAGQMYDDLVYQRERANTYAAQLERERNRRFTPNA